MMKPSQAFQNRQESRTSTGPSDIRGGDAPVPAPLHWNTTTTLNHPEVSKPVPETRRSVFRKSRFLSPWAQRRQEREAKSDPATRGPLGLRLLCAASEPLVNLIFVHGLHGASVKTWQKGKDPDLFWPQRWLPLEPEFRNVSIHTFGYDADWTSSRPSILSIHDFGQSLLEEIRNSPYLRDNAETPIILLGHSMGGLVIKKAFNLSHNISVIHDRIRCIFFLATPHRGSDHAATLNRILAVSGFLSSRLYIADLKAGSRTTQLINEEFAAHARDLALYSFYETLSMDIGLSSSIIVEKDSAVLGPGYRNERVQYMNADHKHICKFDSRDDSNYVTLKNALAGAVQDLVKDVVKTRQRESKEQTSSLSTFLGIYNQPEEHYQKAEGSCRWIDMRHDFQDWRDQSAHIDIEDTGENPAVASDMSIFWVHANPGTGKTYLASHVISGLQELRLSCAHHYFHIRTRDSQSLGGCLRSIAYQMAVSNASVRDMLLELYQNGTSFDMDDALSIWNKVFKNGIYQASVYNTQYWVIDAIDECERYQELISMIKSAIPNFPLRIFMTSRTMADMPRICRSLEPTVSFSCISIPEQSSIDDIERYIQARTEDLSFDNSEERRDLQRRILQRSNTSFLWARLVLDELEQVYSKESMLQVLEEIPDGMISYYERTIRAMSAAKSEKHIAKAILAWTVASCQRLTLLELSHALELDLSTKVLDTKGAVEGLCGHLVQVNTATGTVDVIHPTVREFLQSANAGEFVIVKEKAHERLALTCLQLLSSAALHPPRGRRLAKRQQKKTEPVPLLDYAMTQFFEHVYGASAGNDEVFQAVVRFFGANALSWIEQIARKGSLQFLTRASKNLRAYADRRARCQASLDAQVKSISDWSVDLNRLVVKFGAALLQSPPSIHALIPPLCPSRSAISQQIDKRPDNLTVVGAQPENWEDCLAFLSLEDDIPVAVACGESRFAVGMESCRVNLYNNRSYQKEGVLQYKYPVDCVHVVGKFVAASTVKNVTVHDSQGNLVWETAIRYRCIFLTSAEDVIIAVTGHGQVLQWDMSSGELLDDHVFAYRPVDSDSEPRGFFSRAPSIAAISPNAEVLALNYADEAICLWELDSGDLIGWSRDDDDSHAAAMVFNPNPEASLLLVIYTDHNLSLFDSWSGDLVNKHKTAGWNGVLSACCSPDGRTFATADTRGNLQIWDFNALTLLYRILAPSLPFRVLQFSSDGSSIIEVMDTGMRIWSPVALVRQHIKEDGGNDKYPLEASEGHYQASRTSRITCLCAHPSLPIVVVGKYNGDVLSYSTRTGKQTSVLYSHSSGGFITRLAIGTNNTVASSDANSVTNVWKLVPGPQSTLEKGTLVLQKKLSTPIRQLCFSSNDDFLIIATAETTQVYSMMDGSCVGAVNSEVSEGEGWKWFAAPNRDAPDHFFLVSGQTLTRYNAQSISKRIEVPVVHLQYELPEGSTEPSFSTALVETETQTLILEVQYQLGYVSSSMTFLFDLNLSSASTVLEPVGKAFTNCCRQFLGICQRTQEIMFLHDNLWVSSIGLGGLEKKEYTQHFFVPSEYTSTSQEVLPVKTAKDDVVFCLYNDLSIVKNGTRFREIRVMEDDVKTNDLEHGTLGS